MSKFPRAVNLSIVRERLVEAGALSKLAEAIRVTLNAQSCLIDLQQSAGSLAALQEIMINSFLENAAVPSEQSRKVVESALLENAITLYVRATHSGADKGSRGSIQIAGKLTTAEKTDHQTLIDVRNKAVAHVHQNKDVWGKSRHRGVILLVECEEGWRPGAAASRVTFDRDLVGCLIRQVPVATRIISSQVDGLFRKLADLIILNESDYDLQKALKDSEVSLSDFFSSGDEVTKFIADRSPGI